MEFFAVLCSKACDRCVKDCAMFASRIIIVEHITGRILSVNTFSVDTFYHVYAIFVAVKQCVDITHNSPMCAALSRHLLYMLIKSATLCIILSYLSFSKSNIKRNCPSCTNKFAFWHRMSNMARPNQQRTCCGIYNMDVGIIVELYGSRSGG